MARSTGVRLRVDAGGPEKSAAFESAVLRSAPVPLLVFDTARDRLVFANRRAEALLGASRDELAEVGLGASIAWEANARGQRTPGALHAALANAAAGNEACCELGLHTGHGPARRVRLRCEPTFGAGPFVSAVLEEQQAPPRTEASADRGVVSRAAGGAAALEVGTDAGMTELRAAYEGLRRTEVARARSKRLASVGLLAAGVAHEINNPLAYILNNLDFALNHLPRGNGRELGPEAAEALEEAREGALRVREVVKDLRTFSRTGETRQQLLDVREVVEASLNLARGQILACAKLSLSWSGTLRVRANRARLVQVFVNLLVNACEAIEPGHPESNTISVSSRDDGGWLEVVVKDTGIGILPSEIDQIFDLFYTTKAVGEGPGLGLSICHDLVEAIGGSIQVASEVGHWTELRVRLPGALAEASPNVERNEPNVWQRAKRLLVVDDDPLVARSVRRLLGGEQHVTLALDGQSALAALRENHYDIVLCDVVMPEMDGVSLLEAVRAERPEAARRFVFMTGSLFDGESRRRMQAVSAPCINKPLDITELTLALGQVLDAPDAGAG